MGHLLGRVFLLVLLCTALHAYSISAAPAYTCTTPANPANPLPETWTRGAVSCFGDDVKTPAPIQVFQYDEHTYILREDRCVNYEGPFMYLLLGNQKAVLLDTGATVSAASFPIREVVEGLLEEYLGRHGRQRSELELVVAHTHAHDDHVSGDSQFAGQPHTTVVSHSDKDVAAFFGLTTWPEGTATYDLSGGSESRPLLVVPVPGHEASSIALYDCATHLLLTGDSLYPGRLYLADLAAGTASAARLNRVVSALGLDVAMVLGAHVEMTRLPRVDYLRGTLYTPEEHGLPLTGKHVGQLAATLAALQTPAVVKTSDFIVVPKHLPALAPGGRAGTHGMVVMRDGAAPPAAAAGGGGGGGGVRSDRVFLSHVPMFEEPHDYQVLLAATITGEYEAMGGGEYMLMPMKMSLNDIIEGRLTEFTAELWLGSFEHDGTKLASVTTKVTAVVASNHLEPNEPVALEELRYFGLFAPAAAAGSGGAGTVVHLVHHIHQAPDFDHVVRATVVGCTSDAAADVDIHAAATSGDEWYIAERLNAEGDRVQAGAAVRAVLVGDAARLQCVLHVDAELSCLKGPDFADLCDAQAAAGWATGSAIV